MSPPPPPILSVANSWRPTLFSLYSLSGSNRSGLSFHVIHHHECAPGSWEETLHLTVGARRPLSEAPLSSSSAEVISQHLVAKHPAAAKTQQQALTERGRKQKPMKTVGEKKWSLEKPSAPRLQLRMELWKKWVTFFFSYTNIKMLNLRTYLLCTQARAGREEPRLLSHQRSHQLRAFLNTLNRLHKLFADFHQWKALSWGWNDTLCVLLQENDQRYNGTNKRFISLIPQYFFFIAIYLFFIHSNF